MGLTLVTGADSLAAPMTSLTCLYRKPNPWRGVNWLFGLLTALACWYPVALLAEIAPPPSIIASGIPAIPDSVAADVDRYREFRGASFLDWHPVRREMIVRTRFGANPQIHWVRFPEGARRQFTFSDDNISRARFDPNNGDYLVMRRDRHGRERNQLYRYEFKSKLMTLLTDGKSINRFGVWSSRGDRMAYGSSRRNGKDIDLYVLDPGKAGSDRLLAKFEQGRGRWYPLDWSHDDKKIVMLEFVSVNESYLWLVDTLTGTKRKVGPDADGNKVAYGSAGFSRDGGSLFVTTDRDSEVRQLARLDLASNTITYLTSHVPWDIQQFSLSGDRQFIAYVINRGGVGQVRWLDTATGKEEDLADLPQGVVANLRWHRNNRDLGFTLSTARGPSEAYSYDVVKKNLQRWTFSETGGLNTEQFVEPSLIQWASFDGRLISGFYYRAPGRFPGKRPVLIDIHGGPEAMFRPGFLGSYNYYLNELGVALIFPNIRGSTGFGKTFAQLDDGLRREDAYKDIGALLQWIRSRPELDGDRILVGGESYGGHVALAVAARYNDEIACSFSAVGPSNLATFLDRTADYRRDMRRREYGDERDPQQREFLERTAPANEAHRIKKPLLVIQGKNDPRVPFAEADQMVAAVRRHRTPVWYLVATDEGHGFVKKPNRDFEFYVTVQFVKTCLLSADRPPSGASRANTQ